jgi:nucleoside-diphosphate-sugar epimerase
MTKKIAVTGGSGKLGRACIDALLEDGWTPFNFDLVPPRQPNCSFTLGFAPEHHWRDRR